MPDLDSPLAIALATIKHHGDGAHVFAAARLGQMKLEGDEAGAAMWLAVCRELDGMRKVQ